MRHELFENRGKDFSGDKRNMDLEENDEKTADGQKIFSRVKEVNKNSVLL